MSNQELVQYVEAPKSVEPAVRSVSRFKELPLWKRGLTLATLGLSTIAAACSGTAGNETTTTPPSTSPTTITTEVPTTTTEAPTTTTNVPETTTTLPVDCSQATGQARIGNQNIDLGLYREGYPFAPFQEGITGRLINLYEKEYEDFQGQKANVLYADICVGELSDNSLFIVPVMLGRPEIDTILTIFYSSSDLNTASQPGSNSYFPLSELKIELEKRLANNSQIGLLIVTSKPTSASTNWQTVQDCVEDLSNTEFDTEILPYCEHGFENMEYFSTNSKFVDFLKNEQLELANQLLNENSLAANGVFLFISQIPLSTP